MESSTKKTFWNLAGTAGLLMGLTSTASMFAGQFLSSQKMAAIMTTITGLVVWAIETGVCIYIMYFFMKRFVQRYPEADNKKTFRLGMAMAFFSALIYSAASFANIAFISADMYNEQFQLLMQQMGSMMDSNSKVMIEKIMENLPQIVFFSNLIYCFLFGTVVSAIMSRQIPSRDPFA